MDLHGEGVGPVGQFAGYQARKVQVFLYSANVRTSYSIRVFPLSCGVERKVSSPAYGRGWASKGRIRPAKSPRMHDKRGTLSVTPVNPDPNPRLRGSLESTRSELECDFEVSPLNVEHESGGSRPEVQIPEGVHGHIRRNHQQIHRVSSTVYVDARPESPAGNRCARCRSSRCYEQTTQLAMTMGRAVLMDGPRVPAATAAALSLKSVLLHPRCDGVGVEGVWGVGSISVHQAGGSSVRCGVRNATEKQRVASFKAE